MPSLKPADNSHTGKVPGTPTNPDEAKNIKLFEPFQQKDLTFHNRVGVR